jgi:hypothetical protein
MLCKVDCGLWKVSEEESLMEEEWHWTGEIFGVYIRDLG